MYSFHSHGTPVQLCPFQKIPFHKATLESSNKYFTFAHWTDLYFQFELQSHVNSIKITIMSERIVIIGIIFYELRHKPTE